VLILGVFFVNRSQAAAPVSSPQLLLVLHTLLELLSALPLSSLPRSERLLVERRD